MSPYPLHHREIASQAIGRPIEKGEVVHHINGDANDNRPENLVVLGTREHHKIHYASDLMVQGAIPVGIEFACGCYAQLDPYNVTYGPGRTPKISRCPRHPEAAA